MRLIDADIMRENLEWCKSQSGRYDGIYWDDVIERLDIQPTVDAAPAVHARWIEPVPGDGFTYCGNCKAPALNKGLFLNPKLMDWYKTKYCPNCGAKMDLEEQKCTFTDTEH